jgi:adenine-specific DNA-methyltransferase
VLTPSIYTISMTEKDKSHIIDLIKAGEKIPKEYIYKLFADEEDVFLFWNGRKEDVTNVALPFHSIEHIDEPRKETMKGGDAYSMFDTRGRQLQGWTNKLIWGDNKLILSSLVNGPLRKDIEAEGGLKLIYIDPPFAVGADFGFNIEIGGETAEKKQSVIEEIAYRDTWGKGISSYLSMMYERLKLMHSLLAEDGSIYVHCDWKTSAYLRLILNDVFGNENFRNELYWYYYNKMPDTRKGVFPRSTDTILWYVKNKENYAFNPLEEKRETPVKQLMRKKVEGKMINARDEDGNVMYQMRDARVVDNVWRLSMLQPADDTENLNYPTQKPETILERIINASSNEGDLIADFFCGSGTTAAVAEKLGRKWITTDLGRFSVHTARKRMIGVQRELQAGGKDFRAFEVLNLGKYERQFFMDDLTNGQLKSKEDAYIGLILEAYKAKRLEGGGNLHGSKAGRLVHVGPLDVPVTQRRLEAIFEECREKLYTQVDVLGFEFEQGLVPRIVQEMKERGVSITIKYIPKEVFDKRVVDKGQARFFDVAYLNTQETVKDRTVTLQLTDFVTHYTQDDLEDLQQTMKAGSKVVIDDGQIWKIEKDPSGIINRTLLTQNWFDWIDYWAIDFDYHSKKEIIKVKNETTGETEEQWTGNYLFENEWQSFRTKKDPTIEFVSVAHAYKQPGVYKIMVKVVDILGIDTSKLVEVRIA